MSKKIAFLATDGFEKSELQKPYEALSDAGYEVFIVSPKAGQIKSWDKKDWGESFDVDIELKDADPNDFDALVLPGGVINPDHLRRDRNAVKFVKSFFQGDRQKPVGAICHGPWMLVEADVVKNRKLTSFNSIHTDLVNAGALWEDAEVVVDKGLVTSRNPDDIPAFIAKLKEEIEEGPHQKPPRASEGYVDQYQSPSI